MHLQQEALAMSPGEQMMDLVHIEDVTEAFVVGAAQLPQQSQGHTRYGISSGIALRLIDVVSEFEEATGLKLPIVWGRRLSRPREVMVPWTSYMTLPGWQPRVPFARDIQQTRPVQHENI